jgi:hypothetical protein
MAGQSIRPSQFITTYGPGSILEGPDGPRIILSLEHSGLFSPGRRASDFDITYERLSAVLDGGRVVRLPTNAELNIPDAQYIYRTDLFPRWSLCVEHGILYRYRGGKTAGCVRCAGGSPEHILARARREAIRFVRACPAGHLDDVDWIGIVTHRQKDCQPDYLLWEGHGALRNIEIRCPECKGSINLAEAYARKWSCSGRYPEKRTRVPCAKDATIVQRGAANLRVPELVSTINILPYETPLHRLLSRPSTRGALSVSPPDSKEKLIAMLKRLVENHLIPASDPVEVERYDATEVMEAVRAVCSSAPASVETALNQELRELQRAAARGAPPVPPRTPGMPPIFEVIREDVRCLPGPCGRLLRVTPVSRLQVTMAQRGYRRLVLDDPNTCDLVSVAFIDGQDTWYPGIELSGEGIFIDLAPAADGSVPQHFPLQGEEAQAWLQAWADPVRYGRRQAERDRLHPVFVWWHTFAHRLITALAVDSGYSSAAVRERIYTEIDLATGQGCGGILLYTVQPGGDGTLGGLISLVRGFERVLGWALRDLDACSNDPLCGEEHFAPGRYNGSACYACLLISETSCEFLNTSLDRNLLRTNLP